MKRPKVEYKEHYINQDMREKKVKDVKFDAPKEAFEVKTSPEPEPVTAPQSAPKTREKIFLLFLSDNLKEKL